MKISQECALRIAAMSIALSVSAGASAAAGSNLISGGSFDSAADIAFWTPGLSSSLAFTTNDAQGSPTSGSMQITLATTPRPDSISGGSVPSASATQCIGVVPAASYNFGASVFGGSFSVGSMTCSAFTGVNDCSGAAAVTAQSNQTTTGQDFTWVPVVASLTVPADGSVLCELDYFDIPPPLQSKSATRPWGQLPSAAFDDVVFQNPTPVSLQSFDVQ